MAPGRHYGAFMTVVALGAYCDLASSVQAPANPGDLSFAVSEFAVLDDGRRITLHADRGWSESLRRYVPKGEPLPVNWGEPLDPWEHMSRDDLMRSTLLVVLPDDDDDPDDHPYEWLAGRLSEHGIRASAAELRCLPYTVELSPQLEQRLPRA